MEKFKCKDCAHVFEGDLSTTKCPNCESENIDLAKKKFSRIIIVILLLLVAVVFVFRSCPKKALEVRIEQSSVANCIDLHIKNFKPEYASRLNVKIERDNQFFNNIPLKDAVTQLELPTGCYTFYVSFLDGRKAPKIYQCLDTICFGTAEPTASQTVKIEEKTPPLIKEVTQNQNCQTKRWDVQIIAKSNEQPLEYSIDGGKTFGSETAFHLSPGVYHLVVKDNKGTTATRDLVLGKILCAKTVTLVMLQSWVDRLAMGDSKAQEEFDLYFSPKATAVGVPNANTAYQLMIEILTTQESVKVKSMDVKTENNATKVTRIVVQ